MESVNSLRYNDIAKRSIKFDKLKFRKREDGVLVSLLVSNSHAEKKMGCTYQGHNCVRGTKGQASGRYLHRTPNQPGSILSMARSFHEEATPGLHEHRAPTGFTCPREQPSQEDDW